MKTNKPSWFLGLLVVLILGAGGCDDPPARTRNHSGGGSDVEVTGIGGQPWDKPIIVGGSHQGTWGSGQDTSSNDPPPPPPPLPPPRARYELASIQGKAADCARNIEHALEAYAAFHEIVDNVDLDYLLSESFGATPALSDALEGRLWLRWHKLVTEPQEEKRILVDGLEQLKQIQRSCASSSLPYPDTSIQLIDRWNTEVEDFLRTLAQKYRDLRSIGRRLGLELPSWEITPLTKIPLRKKDPKP